MSKTPLDEDVFVSSLLLDLASEEEGFTTLLLESSFLTEELLLSSLTELEEFLVVAEELDSLDFSTDEEDSSLGSGAGAELLDSSPQATNKKAESNNATKYFTENLQEPQSFLPSVIMISTNVQAERRDKACFGMTEANIWYRNVVTVQSA